MSKISRVERQLLAVAALSLTLVAIVLGLGGLAVSRLGATPLPVSHAPATTAGIYKVVTPVPTPFASPQPRVPEIHATAVSHTAPVVFRPPLAMTTAAAKPARKPVARVATASRKHASKPRAKRHRARKRASRPTTAPAAVVASVAPAQPAAQPVRISPSTTRGNSGKPKFKAPVHAKKPKFKPVPAAPAPAPAPVAAPAPAAAPPAHGHNGRGHGVGGTPPGAAKAHGNGNGKGH